MLLCKLIVGFFNRLGAFIKRPLAQIHPRTLLHSVHVGELIGP